MKVSVDPDRRQGHARCWEVCPEVFFLDNEGHAPVAVDSVHAVVSATTGQTAAVSR